MLKIGSYSNQNGVVLVKGQTNSSVEQTRKPRNRPMQKQPTDFKQIFEKGAQIIQFFSTTSAGTTAKKKKNESRQRPYIFHKN